jgi:hypothetical protein
MEEMRNTYKILVRKPEEIKSAWNCRCRWEGNARMDHSETGYEDLHCIYPALDRDQQQALVNTVMNLQVP